MTNPGMERVAERIRYFIDTHDGIRIGDSGYIATIALTEARKIADEGGTHLKPEVYEAASVFLGALLED